MKDPEPPENPARRLAQESLREMEIEARTTPIVLDFPPEVIEACETYIADHSIDVNYLIPIAMVAERDRFDEFVEAANRLEDDIASFEWPVEDPLRCIALAFTRTMSNRLREKGIELDWNNIDPDDFDPDNWWKTL
jgi:hypothetical protein